MLEIHQNENTEKYTDYLDKLNISGTHMKVVEAHDRNRVTGFCIFSYAEDAVTLYVAEYGEDLYLCDGLVRAVLFKASLLGIDRAEFAFADLADVRKLGFLEKDSRTLLSIQSIMGGCKSCK